MHLLQSDDQLEHISSYIHQDTQQHNTHFDLTISEVYDFTAAGSLDFGGSEFKEAGREPIHPQTSAGDDYGWWNLSAGTYCAVLNETVRLDDSDMALLALHPHAQKAGLTANAKTLSTENNSAIELAFSVPQVGCNIKENARFAALCFLAE